MSYQGEQGEGAIGLVEAVETLTSIADLQIDGPIAVAEKHEIELQDMPIIYRTVHWLHRKNAEKVMHVVRDTYKIILSYLRHFYKQEYGKLVKHESVEGIKTIMVLVGEAAQKVDKYSRIFVGANVGSVRETKEFRDLLSFYQRKIAPIAAQESLSKWIEMLPVKSVVEVSKEKLVPRSLVTEHIFVDLDSVKKDSEYELFFIRKEDGSRFFNPRLIRNIKLVCNFEQYVGEEAQVDPLRELKTWKDHSSQLVARNLLRQNWVAIDQFVKACAKHYNNELAMNLYRAVVALMLSANQSPSLKELSKGSSSYFRDFHSFLRELLTATDFHRLLTYPPKDEESIGYKIVLLAEDLTHHLFSDFHLSFDVNQLINQLIVQGRESLIKEEPAVESQHLALNTKMEVDYDSLVLAMQHFGHAPLLHLLEEMQEMRVSGFDNFLLQNYPSCIFDLFPKGRRIPVLRIPSPTTQDYIHKAQVSEEFKTYLRSFTGELHDKKLLLFNLQDRTGWREYARCHALEELQKNDEFSKKLIVVSLTKESDFYHQSGPYQDLNQADQFITQLIEHTESEIAGYYFPAKVQKSLSDGFLKALAVSIHELFFAHKNVLSRHARMDFIELYYLFLQLKVIELVQPTSIGISCKDGLDITMATSAALFLVLKLLNDRPLSAAEEEYVKLMLYSPNILVRGRNLFLDRFTRLNSMIKLIEQVVDEQGAKRFHQLIEEKVSPLFDKDILTAVVAIPQPLL